MRIVADSAIKLAREAFSALGDLVLLSADEINPRTIREANVLLVRTETRIDAALLSGSAVRFVATATTGTDHVDLHLLEEKGIAFSSAAGCNANAVCEYIVAILLSLAKERGWSLQGSTLGVVGVGKIGSRVARVGAALGMEVLKNDPPLARQSGSADFLELDDLMGVDYLTIHVPLTFRGADPTHHLFDEDRLERLKGATVLINTSRGSVVDGSALKQCLVRGRLSTCVLDVWEHEPGIDFSLLEKVSIGTPHIAGYSLDDPHMDALLPGSAGSPEGARSSCTPGCGRCPRHASACGRSGTGSKSCQ